MSIPDHVALAIGHDYQASEIERDPTLCPEFSDAGRTDIVRALRILAKVEGKEWALVPVEPIMGMYDDYLYALKNGPFDPVWGTFPAAYAALLKAGAEVCNVPVKRTD